MKKALVVGGRHQFILDTIKPKLARYGIEVLEHWDMEHKIQASKTVPTGAELVILFKDMHPQATALGSSLWSQGKKLGIPYISTTRKASFFQADLMRAGFELLATVPVPVEPPPPAAPAAPMPEEGVPLPTWVMQSIKAGTPILLTPDHETALFNVGTERSFTVLVRVTPADAERWLETRVRVQRPVSQRHVEELASAFRRGEYHFTHQGIAFNKDGANQDGQHRLWAIFNSGVTVDINVTFGQPPEAMRIIDSKIRPRAAWQNRQILTGDAQSKKKLEAALVVRLLVYPDQQHMAPSFDESEDIIATYREGLDWCVTLPAKKVYGTAPVRGALAFAHRTAPVMVEAFAEQVLHGENLQRGMPAFAIRNMLEATIGRTNRRDVALKVLRACQGYMQAENMPKATASEEAVTFFGKVHGIK
jgi:hypothetical protein